ncbi:MAG: MFS transporter, partial [Bacteroidales bacterium]
ASVHLLFALPILDEWWFAVLIMLVLGVAFSLVPSAMWPSVPKIIPQNQLGTAYSLIFYIQNIGLMCVPMLIGWVIDRYAKIPQPDGTATYDYTIPMIIFTMFGVAAIFVAVLLKYVNKKEGYGLEEPNMK